MMPQITRCIQCTRTAADVFESSPTLGYEASPPSMRFTCSLCGSTWESLGFGGWTEIWRLMSDPDPWPAFAKEQQDRDVVAFMESPMPPRED